MGMQGVMRMIVMIVRVIVVVVMPVMIVVMMIVAMMIMTVMVVTRPLDLGAVAGAAADRAHQFTSSSLIRSSSPLCSCS